MAGFVVGLAQKKGGVGKSTLAAQLAVACCRKGRNTSIVDIDPQGSLMAWAALRAERGLQPADQISVEQGAAWRLPFILGRLFKDGDLVVVDGASREDDFTAMAASSDLMLIPCQPTALDLWATKDLMERHPEVRSKSLVVLNRMPPRGKAASMIREEIEKLSWPMARQHIGNRQAFVATIGAGLGVADVAPSSLAGAEIDALASEILERMAAFRLAA